LGNLENQVVSALNRGVATRNIADWDDPTKYYNEGAYNVYAQFFHQNGVTINNQAYAFAFDDQQGQASDISVAKFASATITLGAWTTTQFSNGDLYITGTSGDDSITVQDLGKKKGIQVMVNGKVEGTFKNLTGTIFADGVGGNDVISVASTIKLAASLLGGDGDDILIGGAGVCTFDGGLGKNMLVGRKNRDIVVEGGGADQLIMSKKASYWSAVADALAPLSKNKKFSATTFNLLKKLIR
jgi:Ca2+-binding RTX toxin-like protein